MWFFASRRNGKAVKALRRYSEKYTGSRFERIADTENPNRITERDLVAVSMLNVSIPASTSIWLLEDGADHVAALLADIPVGQTLWSPDVDLSPTGALWRLWGAVRSGGWPTPVGGMGRTKTSKLLAAKRPQLVPIYDAYIASTLFDTKPDNYWETWRQRLIASDGESLRRAATDAHDESGVAEDLSVLRVIDIVIWMWENDRRRPARPG
jgi:hypothetical protein